MAWSEIRISGGKSVKAKILKSGVEEEKMWDFLLVPQLKKEATELLSTHKCKIDCYHQRKLHINKHNINFQTPY